MTKNIKIIEQLKALIRNVEKFKQHKIRINKEDYINEVWGNGCDYGFNEGIKKAISLIKGEDNDRD